MLSAEYQSALLGAGTALTSSVLTFLLIRLSTRLSLVAQVRGDRWHCKATPNTGGVAIVVSCALAGSLVTLPNPYGLILAVGAALAGLGVIDDRLQLRPLTKLAGQAAAAAILIAHGMMFQPTHVAAIDVAITFLWIVGITNAFNLIDNMDGLCAGVTVIIAAFRFLAAAHAGDTGAAFTMAILAGAYSGFLLFNHKPAKIFMGDGGSMFAGFILASVTVSSPAPGPRLFLSGLFYPALTFLYPIFDTALVSVLRRLAGKPVSAGGRDHSSHRLVSLGLSERKAVWLLWELAAAGSTAGFLSAWMPFKVIALGVLLLFAVTLFGVFLGRAPALEISWTAPIRSERIRKLIPALRAGITLAMDVVLASVALLCAFLVRWEKAFPGSPERQLFYYLPVLCVCHAIACAAWRSDRCGWRWFGLADLWRLSKCVASGCALFTCALWFLGEHGFSRGAVLLYAVFALCFAAGMRLLMRVLSLLAVEGSAPERAAILGASEAAELAVLICQRRGVNARPVVVLESDPAANHITMRGVPVRSANGDPLRVLKEARADMLIVPSGLELQRAGRDMVEQCRTAGVRIVRLEVSMTPLRDDLLRLEQAVSPDAESESAVPNRR